MNNLNEFLYSNIAYSVAVISGLVMIFIGTAISVYNVGTFKLYAGIRKKRGISWLNIFDRVTSIFPLSLLKENIKSNLSFNLLDEFSLNALSSSIVLSLCTLSTVLILALHRVGQFWYVKVLVVSMCLVLPYYLASLIFDLYKYRLNQQIPKMIDEFRSAFIKHMKVKPALKECSEHINRNLGSIISRTADSTFLEANLKKLRDKFNNIWLNIFVVLLLNYKESGGELVDQLYRLNKTMTRYNNIEKKKNKRLLWYELFAVFSSLLSIPAVLWLNTAIMGGSQGVIVDPKTNIIISKVIGFSILSLIIIRVLRKL